ncbi:hypothetical protein [Roseibium sp. TrichSKD4]|uniref:hypothetical protein n=1 Tax=Roseibium sp. TrichSKD4 TaxID=744980 RepID=UPI00058F4BC7|nr:hypothetical protein [Roseibium sp. TrichSKD4]
MQHAQLQSVTGAELQWDERIARTSARPLQIADEPLNRRIRSGVAFQNKLLEQLMSRPALPARPLLILFVQGLKALFEAGKLVANRWLLAAITRRGRIRQVLADRVARQPRLLAHGPNAPAIPQDQTPYLRCTFHQ